MKGRILIVEDSTTQREQLRMVLESEGFEVTSAVDGLEGFKTAGELKFDLIVSDIMMPGLTGYDLCRKLKADPSLKSIPIILLTSLSDPMDVIQGLECGADNFIKKPYELDVLIQRVKSVIENKRLQSESEFNGGDELFFLGQRIAIQWDRKQVFNFLISTFEDVVQTNKLLLMSQHELTVAKGKIETHAKTLEGKVFQTEEKYKFIFENAVDAIIGIGLDGLIFSWNHGAEIMYGYGSGEMMGKSYIKLLLPADQEKVVELYDAVMAGKSFPNYDSIRVKKDGTVFDVSTTASPIRDQLGKVIGLSAISRDVTDQKKAEALVKKHEEEMRLVQKMDAIGRLAGGVAHDFNNLLSVIGGNVEFLLDDIKKDNPQREELEEIQKAVWQGAALTKQLLVFGQKQTSQPQSVDLNEISGEMNKMFKRVLEAAIDFSICRADDLKCIQADPGQIQQVILNLVLNAQDAMPQGGSLKIETKNTEIGEFEDGRDDSLPPGPYVQLNVTDTGMGMTPEVQKRIFEPFFTTKAGKGTGLGLASVYSIVKKSNGFIFVESVPGNGTTFCLFFPAQNHPEITASKPQQQALIPLGTETLLLAEDEESVRKILVKKLENYGYQVLQAGDGEEAVQKALDYPGVISLLLTDSMMPKMNGKELADALKKTRPEMKVIFISGYPHEVLAQRGVLDSHIHLIQKPFELDYLAELIRKILDEKRTVKLKVKSAD